MEKQFILFDPVTAERKIITLKLLTGIAGRSIRALHYAKKNRSKIRSLNCYILDLDTSIDVFRELLAKEVIPDEVWRDIPNSLWQVSSYGRYRVVLKNKIDYRLPCVCSATSGIVIGITMNGRQKMYKAHYWVVQLFLGGVPEGYVSYHKNGKRTDNRVENLGFVTRKELFFRCATKSCMKPIIKLDERTGEILEEYPSLTMAAKLNYSHRKVIREGIQQNRPAIGFVWKYEYQVDDELLYAD